MICINCGVATQRLRRHIISSLPILLLNILARWLTIEVPLDANICHPCFELLRSDRGNEARLFGHTMLCISCGRSVRSIQRHIVERHDSLFLTLTRSHSAFYQAVNYRCHPCWIRHQRQLIQNQNRPDPAPVEPESLINLPNYKRAANTSSRCVFYGCAFGQQLHVVPAFIKKMLVQEYNIYLYSS